MNVAEDYDEKIEHLNMHTDLLPPADNNDKLLARDCVALHKALEMDEKTVPFTETDTFPTRTTTSIEPFFITAESSQEYVGQAWY